MSLNFNIYKKLLLCGTFAWPCLAVTDLVIIETLAAWQSYIALGSFGYLQQLEFA